MGGRGSAYFQRLMKHIKQQDDIPVTNIGFFDDPETEYKNQMFHKLKENNISTRQSTDEIDDIILARQQQQIYNISTKYKNILSETSQNYDIQFGAEDIKKHNVIGFCQPTIINGSICQRIVLDKKQFINYDKVVEAIEKGVKGKHFVPINTKFKSRDYLITHEFGHGIENGLFEKTIKKQSLKFSTMNEYLKFKNTQAIKIKNEVIKIWENKYTTGNENDKIELSLYAEANERDWFAETFTNLELSDNPAPISLALKEYLRRYN